MGTDAPIACEIVCRSKRPVDFDRELENEIKKAKKEQSPGCIVCIAPFQTLCTCLHSLHKLCIISAKSAQSAYFITKNCYFSA